MKENNISTRYVDRFPDGKSPISLAFLDNDSNADYTFYKDYPKQRLDVPLPEINEDDIFIYGSYYSLNPALRNDGGISRLCTPAQGDPLLRPEFPQGARP